MTAWRTAAVVITIVCGCTASARAQAADGRFELAGGVLWVGGTGYGSTPATETTVGGSRFTLFSTTTSLASAVGVEGCVGVRLTRLLQAEADASFATATFQTAITGDVENGASLTATEALERLTVGGSLVMNLSRWHVGARGVPFVLAGAGYVRQLHEHRTLIESGQTYQVGGGVKFTLVTRERHRVTAVGIRADVRALARTKGIALDDRAHVSPALGASLFVRF